MDYASDLASVIGNTPLIKLRQASDETGCTILGKAEFLNPGQSVKDRAALSIIKSAVNDGKLKPGGTIVEGTAGNTGIGLALVGASMGFKTVIVIPETQSKEKKDMIRLAGAELIEVPAVPYKNPNNYIKYSGRLAKKLSEMLPEGAIWANQFDNVANKQAHIDTTGPEIWQQTDNLVDGFICACGSGGTLAGVTEFLKPKGVKVGLVDPMGAALFSYFKEGVLASSGGSITEGIGQGRITESDVKLFFATKSNKSFKNQNTTDQKIEQEYSHSEFGEVEIRDIPRVKKLSSKYLMNSWSKIPHVTNHDEADITELEEFRASLTDIYTGEKKKITPLAFIVKALTVSLKKFPNFNTSIDEIENGKMTVKKYFHVGIAVDTPHGLMVPKLRNADNKNISLISTELKKISQQCRDLKIDKKELFGGSMTITSLGSIGGSFFTPIINYPEVAILGVGRAEKKQVFIDGKFVTRIMLPLSLSYDHRIIDGAEAARFNNELKENLGKNFAYKLAV